jgi:hypothetical protein
VPVSTGREVVLDPALGSSRADQGDQVRSGPGVSQPERRLARTAGADLERDRRADEARTARLTPDGGEGQSSGPGLRGGSRNGGERSESDVRADIGPDRSRESAAPADEVSETRDLFGDGSPDAAPGALPGHPLTADLIWSGRSGGVAGPGTEPHPPGTLAERAAAPPVGREAGSAGEHKVLSRLAGDEAEAEAQAGPEGPELAPQLADLLAGVLPFDAAALGRGAEQFFVHLQALGQDPTAASLASRFAPWLATAALAATAVELGRRQRHKPVPPGPGLIAP